MTDVVRRWRSCSTRRAGRATAAARTRPGATTRGSRPIPGSRRSCCPPAARGAAAALTPSAALRTASSAGIARRGVRAPCSCNSRAGGQLKPARCSASSTQSAGCSARAAPAQARAERMPEAQWASTGPASSLKRVCMPPTTRSVNRSNLVVGMWRKGEPRRLPAGLLGAGGIGGGLPVRQVGDDRLEAHCPNCGEILGRSARDGEDWGDGRDFVHGAPRSRSGWIRMSDDMASHENIAMVKRA
jgi:hypothetical protein